MNPSPATPQQQRAISARGNVLVVAGAGAGKTQTLVARCLNWLLDEKSPGSIDDLLMVTFTNAAAAEMRARLRQKLETAKAELEKKGRSSFHLDEQLALLDTAHISTLHSFCFQLISRHFYDLGLDPKAAILPDERARLLARQSLDRVLEKNYSEETPSAKAIQQLIQSQGGDWDQPVRDLILRLHYYSQTLRDPAAWFAAQTALFRDPEPTAWRIWLMEELPRWRAGWLPLLEAQTPENKNAAACAQALAGLSETSARSQFTGALEAILQADKTWAPKLKSKWREPIKKLFDEAEFLHSVCSVSDRDPLTEDWNWARPSMLALLDLAGQFDRAFQDAKRQEGGMDYHDLEQFALHLLWNGPRPSAIAEEWRRKLRMIFVDEYQDINEAQEAIIQALGREGAGANRFLVGDVKQSIYRFRLADPRIFGNYHQKWEADADAQVITLSENFRSHEGILNFVNALFTGFMRKEAGGVDYDRAAHLLFGNAAERGHLSVNTTSTPPVEWHLRRLGWQNEETESSAALDSASDAEKEARLVGRRLLELKNQPAPIFDREGRPREVQWSDMVILLRSPKNKVESYVKEFAQLGIPLEAARGGFYESLEVRDLLSLLQLLDNPLQDLPLLAVLRSPLVGLTVDELALIRIGRKHQRFWSALLHWHKTELAKPAAARAAHFERVAGFLRQFTDWRQKTRQAAVSHCLESIIDQTHYGDWLATQERGAQKRANVERLLELTRQFDALHGESLYRFLKLVEAQQETEAVIEPAGAPSGDAVRLMSIHQSKGLEFPVVALADLGKQFNFSDLTDRIILDEEYGLCPQVKPPGKVQFYPSLPYWLARRRQKREQLGEEMRLLYVAMTRAAQRLILVGSAAKSSLEKKWPNHARAGRGLPEILSSRNYLDWLGSWLMQREGADALNTSGGNFLLTWTLYDEQDSRLAKPDEMNLRMEETRRTPVFTPELRDRLTRPYPFQAETTRPAKTSVSALRRQIADPDGDESHPLFLPTTPRAKGGLNAAEVGLAHHKFLQLVSLDKLQPRAALQKETVRLREQKRMTAPEVASLDLDALAAFWESPIGCQLLEKSSSLERELAFTARFTEVELAKFGAVEFAGAGAGEFVIVQGVMDLAAILPQEIWVLDFKTDHFPVSQLKEKIQSYRPQLELYAKALERIYQRPVTRSWLHFLAHNHTETLADF